MADQTILDSASRAGAPLLRPAGRHFGEGLAGPAGVTLSVYEPGARLPLHEHEEAHLCVVLEGGYAQDARRAEHALSPGAVGVHPAGDRHANTFGAGGAVCLNLALDIGQDPHERGVTRLPPRLRHAAQSLATLTALNRPSDSLEAESLVALLAGEALSRKPAAKDPTAVGRVMQALDDFPERSWTLGELARVSDRHPTHLARAFARVTGSSIGAYRRLQRLRRLTLDLRASGDSLSELALRHGYADQAHMTREFRRAAGAPPGVWRRKARGSR